ncbi:MAG: NUDIX hydrolase [Candidatus Moranbacteria bacterium GW2011_GWA2_39_41]|nr:MAG: NUDIX hydrolase [Candidatus Moranbacteria bacterium GW2011_GWA2_39_41]
MKIFNLSFEKSVGAVVFRESENGEREFLLLHYPSGHWDFPKGHVEKGETEEETLRREVEEETGIRELQIMAGFKDSMRYSYEAKGEEKEKRIANRAGLHVFKRVVYYVAETKELDIQVSFEHIGFEWLNFEKAINRVTFADGKRIMRKAGEFLDKTP